MIGCILTGHGSFADGLGGALEMVGGPQQCFETVTFYEDEAAEFPQKIADAIALALPRLDGKLKGFADPDAVMTAPETRSSSPVRIIRDSSRQSSLWGLYPTGEGAGYAGGIMSAAIDGIMTAEAIIMEENYERETDQQMAP